MLQLPPGKQLANEVLNSHPTSGPVTATSVNYLQTNHTILSGFHSVEDFAVEASQSDDNSLRGALFHFARVRNAIARRLWQREFFIGLSVIESLLFHFLVLGGSDTLGDLLRFVRDKGLHRAGFVVYPLHSLGVLGVGFLRTLGKKRTYFTLDEAGLVLRPQVSTTLQAIDSVGEMKELLKIKAHVPVDLLEHWTRSRPLAWLVKNPVLAVRVQSYPGSYYENQAQLLNILRYSTTALFALATLEPSEPSPVALIGSSSIINNFQTFDFKHYLVFHTRGGRAVELDGDCVPMNVRRAELAETSDMPVELSPAIWKRRARDRAQVMNALRRCQAGYFRHTYGEVSQSLRGRVYRKLHDSLHFFRRSFRQSEYAGESIVALAVAFETLLTDNYAPGVAGRIQDNLRLALRGVRGTKQFQASIANLYDARSEVVHGGSTAVQPNLRAARETFVRAFLGVVSRLDHLPDTSSQPITDILRK